MPYSMLIILYNSTMIQKLNLLKEKNLKLKIVRNLATWMLKYI